MNGNGTASGTSTRKGWPKLRPVSVRDSGEGFRHYFSSASQRVLRGIGAASAASFNGKLSLVTAQRSSGGKNGVSLVSSPVFREVLKAPASRLGKHSYELARSLVLSECEGLSEDPITVTLGRFVISKATSHSKGHALLARITEPTGVLAAEYEEIVGTMRRLEGVSDLEIPAMNPHVTIGTLPPMPPGEMFPVAKRLTARFADTQLTLVPIE